MFLKFEYFGLRYNAVRKRIFYSHSKIHQNILISIPAQSSQGRILVVEHFILKKKQLVLCI